MGVVLGAIVSFLGLLVAFCALAVVEGLLRGREEPNLELPMATAYALLGAILFPLWSWTSTFGLLTVIIVWTLAGAWMDAGTVDAYLLPTELVNDVGNFLNHPRLGSTGSLRSVRVLATVLNKSLKNLPLDDTSVSNEALVERDPHWAALRNAARAVLLEMGADLEGEPLSRRDFFTLGHAARDMNFALRIYTNAHIIDERRADKIASLTPLEVEISIHGARPETHEALTQVPGSFERLLNNVRNRPPAPRTGTAAREVGARSPSPSEARCYSVTWG